MSRRLATVVAVGAAIGVGGFGAPRAEAGHESKDCGVISKGVRDYRVHASFLKCRVARRGSLKYLRSERPRKGFDCEPTEGDNFYCQNPPKAYWAIRL